MIGVTTKEAQYFNFKNVCAFVKITPKVACKSITLETTEAGKYLSGSVNVNYNDGAPSWTTSTVSSALSKKVTLVGNIKAGTAYYIAVLPQTISSGNLKIAYQTEDKFLRASLNEDITLARSTYYDLSESAPTAENFASASDLYVDLGVSVLWATRNLGASKPSEVGSYYAWGEIAPLSGCDESNVYNIISNSFSPVKTAFTDKTYKWGDGSETSTNSYHMSKYAGTFSSTLESTKGDNKTVLDPADDAANILWGNGARIPTKAECEELINGCYWEYYTSSTVNGFWVYKAKDDADRGMLKSGEKIADLTGGSRTTITLTYSSSDPRIFIPFTGFYNDGSSFTAGDTGYYWSSTLCLPSDGNGDNTKHYEQAYDLMLVNAVEASSNLPQIHTDYRRGGQCIRPVRTKNL